MLLFQRKESLRVCQDQAVRKSRGSGTSRDGYVLFCKDGKQGAEMMGEEQREVEEDTNGRNGKSLP
jgi:hypothetical protein